MLLFFKKLRIFDLLGIAAATYLPVIVGYLIAVLDWWNMGEYTTAMPLFLILAFALACIIFLSHLSVLLTSKVEYDLLKNPILLVLISFSHFLFDLYDRIASFIENDLLALILFPIFIFSVYYFLFRFTSSWKIIKTSHTKCLNALGILTLTDTVVFFSVHLIWSLYFRV